MRTWAITLALAASCGHGTDGVGDDSDAPPGGSCDPSCIEMQPWWLATSSNCSVICMANASLSECMQQDCKAIEATRYQSQVRTSLAPMLYSASAHSFYLLGSARMDPYSLSPDCEVKIGTSSPTPFTCSAAGLQLPTALLDPSTQAQNTALDAAATSGASGRYTY